MRRALAASALVHLALLIALGDWHRAGVLAGARPLAGVDVSVLPALATAPALGRANPADRVAAAIAEDRSVVSNPAQGAVAADPDEERDDGITLRFYPALQLDAIPGIDMSDALAFLHEPFSATAFVELHVDRQGHVARHEILRGEGDARIGPAIELWARLHQFPPMTRQGRIVGARLRCLIRMGPDAEGRPQVRLDVLVQ